MKKNILYEKLSKGCGFISVVGYFYPIFLAYVYLKTMSADDYKYFIYTKADLQLYIDDYFKIDHPRFIVAIFFGLLSITFHVLHRKTK
ncbi:hypothetical protein ACQFD1_005590 [Klebsiella oxytoca]|uniref:hypothetical protein n=1 Tax=Serratia marcescens TaxID=615 RepID=UPI001F1537B0|nr:hypothetical protein [Serratia marcescens]EAP9570873.1 hypothetical protein [Salmonella enterica]EAQ1034824.1 hypothetical protein [Salmonella enterica]EAR7420338.1 hypothetical protein [Salmonella enterica]ECU8971386.1 hypothetical protein [Salmonella enterica]